MQEVTLVVAQRGIRRMIATYVPRLRPLCPVCASRL